MVFLGHIAQPEQCRGASQQLLAELQVITLLGILGEVEEKVDAHTFNLESDSPLCKDMSNSTKEPCLLKENEDTAILRYSGHVHIVLVQQQVNKNKIKTTHR